MRWLPRSNNTVLPPTRPSFLRLPMLLAPTTSEQNTIGTISILMDLMKRSPSSLITAMEGPTIRPTIAPKANPIRISTQSLIQQLPALLTR